MSQIGTCPICNQGPRNLTNHRPETKQCICSACYQKSVRKEGICPECEKGPRPISYRHPKTGKNVCHNCYNKAKREEKGLPWVPKKPAKPVAVKRYRKNPYPTKESVEKALEVRVKEGKKNNAKVLFKEDASLYRKALEFKVKLPKAYESTTVRRIRKPARLRRTPVVLPSLAAKKTIKPKSKPGSEPERMIRKYLERLGEKAKYPDREAVIAALENREIREKDNFPSVLRKEDSVLYHLALWFNVELPIEKNSLVKYCPGDLVKNQNPRDPDICGMIGKVLDVDDKKKEVRVDFRERGRITRIYRKWENFNSITLHARNPLVPAEVTRKELVLV